MKLIFHPKNLPLATVVCGLVGLLLRIWLLGTENEKGFVDRSHISATLLLILTGVYLLILVIATRPLQQANKYRFNFPASVPGAIGSLAGAVVIALLSLGELSGAADALVTFCALLGVLAAVALVFISHCRWKGLHPSTLFHIVVCAWLMLRLICMYRQWSSDPQLLDYCFQLLAIVCMMLYAYQRATFDANFGRRDLYVLFDLAGVYFCCLSLAGPDDVAFYLGSAAWLFTDLCNLTPMPRATREK